MAAKLLPWLVRLLAATALGLSAFLWWSSTATPSMVGCNAFAGFDCDAALASPWAKWLGLPVAAGGVLCYGAALAGSLLAGRSGGASSVGWRLMELAAPLAVGAGVWFVGVQIAALDSFCLYCLVAHACGLLMVLAIALWRVSATSAEERPLGVSPIALATSNIRGATGPQSLGPPSLGLPTVAGLIGVLALAGGQTMFAPPTVSEYRADLTEQFNLTGDDTAPTPSAEPADEANVADTIDTEEEPSEAPPSEPARRRDGSRKVKFLKGQLTLDTYEQAMLGSPDAPHIVVEMMDYACPHCREFQDKLDEALKRFDGQIAVVVLPVPGEIVCNPYVRKARKQSVGACFAAKLSLAFAEISPEGFPKFHEWMLEDDSIPSRGAMQYEALKRVDGDKLSRVLQDAEGSLAARIKNHVELSAALSKSAARFGFPAQILGDKVIAGPPKSTDELCEKWAEAFGLETPRADIPF